MASTVLAIVSPWLMLLCALALGQACAGDPIGYGGAVPPPDDDEPLWEIELDGDDAPLVEWNDPHPTTPQVRDDEKPCPSSSVTAPW